VGRGVACATPSSGAPSGNAKLSPLLGSCGGATRAVAAGALLQAAGRSARLDGERERRLAAQPDGALQQRRRRPRGHRAEPRGVRVDAALRRAERVLHLRAVERPEHPQRGAPRLAHDGAVRVARERVHRRETRAAREGGELVC